MAATAQQFVESGGSALERTELKCRIQERRPGRQGGLGPTGIAPTRGRPWGADLGGFQAGGSGGGAHSDGYAGDPEVASWVPCPIGIFRHAPT
jgi:hypothetical protein